MVYLSQEFLNNRITKLEAIVNNSFDEAKRVESIYILKDLAVKNEEFFTFFENLLISDANPKIRNLAVKIIKNHYLEKAFEPMCWAYKHENSIECILNIISTLGKINNQLSKEYLVEKLFPIKIPQFRNYIDKLLERNEIYNLSSKNLANLLKNYHIINDFISNFELIKYKIKDGRIIDLDFSFTYNNGFTQSIIEQLPRIIEDLKDLRSLNLKYNKLKMVPNFIKKLKSLKYLNLSNNQINIIPHYISEMNLLEHLDLSWNYLNTMPPQISLLKNLKILNLKHNKIQCLSEPLIELKKRGLNVQI